MAIRFHKRFKIAPGLTLNLNKKSISVRAGPKNAGLTTGTKGTTISASVPQTGLSVQKKLGQKAKARGTAPPPETPTSLQQFGRTSAKGCLVVLLLMILVATCTATLITP